jgi:bacteriocin-like protein
MNFTQVSNRESAAENQTEKSPMFVKRTVVELNDNELSEVNGGTGTPCYSASMAVVASVVQMGQWGYEFGQWLR